MKLGLGMGLGTWEGFKDNFIVIRFLAYSTIITPYPI